MSVRHLGPANSRALIRRSYKALQYCEAGLELQDIDLGGMEGERPVEEVGESDGGRRTPGP